MPILDEAETRAGARQDWREQGSGASHRKEAHEMSDRWENRFDDDSEEWTPDEEGNDGEDAGEADDEADWDDDEEWEEEETWSDDGSAEV